MLNKINMKVIIVSILLVFFGIFVAAIVKINIYSQENKKINKEIHNTIKNIAITKINDDDKTEYIIDNTEIVLPYNLIHKFMPFLKNVELIENKLKKELPYYKIKYERLINVDIDRLKSKNKNTKGWLEISGTNIKYPFVQYKNNKYYSNHSFNNNRSHAGWLFLDSRNNINEFDKNTIIYLNGNLIGTDFEEARNLIYSHWLHEEKNHSIKMVTEKNSSLWQVVSAYIISSKDENLEINFSKKNFKKYSKKILKDSIMNFKSDIDENDNILTFSINYSDSQRIVIHAKLIKYKKM